jgi:hypothetical protein
MQIYLGPETHVDFLRSPIEHHKESAAIMIGPLEFLGPHTCRSAFNEQAGLLAVLVDKGHDFELVHIYQTANIHASATLELSDNFLDEHAIALAAHYTGTLSAQERHKLAEKIWQEFDDSNDELELASLNSEFGQQD